MAHISLRSQSNRVTVAKVVISEIKIPPPLERGVLLDWILYNLSSINQ